MEQVELLMGHTQKQEQSRTHTRKTSSRKGAPPPAAAEIRELTLLPWPGRPCSYKIIGAQVPDTIVPLKFHVKKSLFLTSSSHCHVGVSDTCH